MQACTHQYQFTFATTISTRKRENGYVYFAAVRQKSAQHPNVHCDYLSPIAATQAPNLECFVSRIAEHPERLQNVYFNYVLLLRALARAGDYVDHFALRPGDEIADVQTREKFNELVHVARDCPPTFDEHSMFVGPDAAVSSPVQCLQVCS